MGFRERRRIAPSAAPTKARRLPHDEIVERRRRAPRHRAWSDREFDEYDAMAVAAQSDTELNGAITEALEARITTP